MINFFSKKLNKKGFTLAELLIVVAIIAVLVAIAVPIFTGALEKARYGVHKSNARSLKSQGVALILGDKNFDAATTPDGKGEWLVAATYNFATEQYSNYVVTPITSGDTITADRGAGSYFVLNAAGISDGKITVTSVAGGSTKDLTNNWAKFGGSVDEKIGKIKTSGVVSYAAIITEQDLTDASITLTK